MKQLIIVFGLTLSLISCSFFDKGKKAIEICQKAKIQFQTDNALSDALLNAYGMGANGTWLDYANMIAKKDPDKRYDWHAKETDEKNIYLVDFVDTSGWGHRWEVDVEQQIVKNINQSDYLSRKYGLSRFDGSYEFVIMDGPGELKIKKHSEWDFSSSSSSDIVYEIKASVMNSSGKTITKASVEGKLKLIFKDKTIVGESGYYSGFVSTVSEREPWEPNTRRYFNIETKGIEKIYLNYIPEYVIFNVSLKAEDPVGYEFDKDIAEYDLKENWKSFKSNPTSSINQ